MGNNLPIIANFKTARLQIQNFSFFMVFVYFVAEFFSYRIFEFEKKETKDTFRSDRRSPRWYSISSSLTDFTKKPNNAAQNQNCKPKLTRNNPIISVQENSILAFPWTQSWSTSSVFCRILKEKNNSKVQTTCTYTSCSKIGYSLRNTICREKYHLQQKNHLQLNRSLATKETTFI